MTVLGFTGTRATEPHRDRLMEYFGGAQFHIFASQFDTFVTGGCNGFDAMIGRHLALQYPDKIHCVVVPADRSQVDSWWGEFDLGYIWVIDMPEGTDYRARNEKIVSLSDQLFYCADYPEEHGKSLRSGTWMTKRIADKADVPAMGIVINKEEATHE